MRNILKHLVQGVVRTVGLHVNDRAYYDYCVRHSRSLDELLDLTLDRHCGWRDAARSEIGQDIAALLVNGLKRQGYFVEFGAADGYRISNTYMLETKFDWDGILAEPLPSWHSDIRKHRICKIDERCVWSRSDEVLEFVQFEGGEEGSTIAAYSKLFPNVGYRGDPRTIHVETISLLDLLRFHNAPKVIDYLSVDTEGSEFEILSDFAFNEYRFNFVSIEHNYIESNRRNLRDLMKKNGYKPILESMSKHDDWFVPE